MILSVLLSVLRRLFTREHLGRDLRTAVVALVVSALVVATPSIAATITNADKVDGKDAVGAGASIAQRKGKLVATDKVGRLPGNIINKAPDADRLDGIDGSALVSRNAKPGSVQVGLWSAWGGNSNGYTADAVTFPSRLPADLASARVTFVPYAGAFTTQCPGLRQVAATGWACLYELNVGDAALGNIFQQDTIDGGDTGVSRDGFGIYFNCSADACYSYGQWVVSAPAAGSPRPSAGRGTVSPS